MIETPRADLTRVQDEPRELRSEDAFDVGALHTWLSARVDGLGDPPLVRQFGGGASNLTYLLQYADCDLVLRRPPAGAKAASAHDMRREYRVQDSLRPHYPYVPRMVAFCDDDAVLTTNPAFQHYGSFVTYLESRCSPLVGRP